MEPAGILVVPWTRQVSAADWITDNRSKSYFIELEPTFRESVLDRMAAIIAGAVPGRPDDGALRDRARAGP